MNSKVLNMLASLFRKRLPINTCFFFFNDTATTEIYTLSLHDALPISGRRTPAPCRRPDGGGRLPRPRPDRKSTRLNSSHANISYAVFCLKKKKKTQNNYLPHNKKRTNT